MKCNYPRCHCIMARIVGIEQWTCSKGLPSVHDLSPDQLDLLHWLSKSEFSQYGECYGNALDVLVSKGLAQVHGPGEHQCFIANDFTGDKGMMYRAVLLTGAGHVACGEIYG